MTTNLNQVAVLGGANQHIEYTIPPQISGGGQKVEVEFFWGLGGGALNFGTVMAVLGLKTQLHILTAAACSRDPRQHMFHAALNLHQASLQDHGFSLDVPLVHVLGKLPFAIIRPDEGSIHGSHGKCDPKLTAEAMASFHGKHLPPVRIYTTPRRDTAELGLRFLTVGKPELKVLVCSGDDIFKNPKLVRKLLRAIHVLFLNEAEFDALRKCLYGHKPARSLRTYMPWDVAKEFGIIVVQTSDRRGAKNAACHPNLHTITVPNGVTEVATDPTGAGDNFAGTCLASAMARHQLGRHFQIDERALAAGARAGKVVAMRKGSLAPYNLSELIGEL